MEFTSMTPIEYNNQRVITTELLALIYGTDVNNIHMNYANHSDRFKEGVHYFFIEGETLKEFKGSLPNDIGEPLKYAPKLTLWTERGANRHCKILDTDKAWEQFENLEEVYFRVKKQPKLVCASLDTKARLYANAASFIRTQEQILLNEGHSWHEVGQMARSVCIDCGLPYSVKLGLPAGNEQLVLTDYQNKKPRS